MGEHVFPIAPASGGVYAVLIPIALITVLFGYIAYSARYTSFAVSESGLQIRGDIYGRKIPFDRLSVESARVVDLTTDINLKPSWRTNGVGLPGYKSGWFRLKGGGKGLLFVTDQHRVLSVPTTDGYTLLLSARDPEELLRELREKGR
jgi:hypothetical protein